MGLIKRIIEAYKKKTAERNELCSDYIIRIEGALKEYEDLFADTRSFIEKSESIAWYRKFASLISGKELRSVRGIKRAPCYYSLEMRRELLVRRSEELVPQRERHNDHVVAERTENARKLIGCVEGFEPDSQQLSCIIKEFHNQLVVAGAGTGKTTTIIGKIKYLLASGKYRPEDFLVLSFTNMSADEMSKRINRETGCSIEAMTFHKLGLNIITEAENVRPVITELNLLRFTVAQLRINIRSKSYLGLLCSYLLYNRTAGKSEFDFGTQSEYDEYLRNNPPVTVRKEKVKSYGEMEIANFLTQNGIEYIYEHPYQFDTRTSEYSQYRPDFYLPEYDIYIEYFGIDRRGRVPDYFSGRSGMSASEAYNSSMEWKRRLHKEHGTVMIETYAYEKCEGTLLDNLKTNLMSHNVEMKPRSPEELWEQLSSEEDSVLDGVANLFVTLINLIKSNDYTINTVRKLNIKSSCRLSNEMILTLLEPIYDAYTKYLEEHGEIDFNDMVNKAARYVDAGKYESKYKFIIIDEYQDISKSRYMLVSSLRRSRDCGLFCVGDDWQSIYRFTGSEIGFILDFEKYWGPAEIDKIETTYRFSQDLIEKTGAFIMQNPGQIRKSIRGRESEEIYAFAEIRGYRDCYAVDFMLERLEELPKNSSVFFIGRYNFDHKMLEENEMLNCRYDKGSGFYNVVYRNRPDLKMQFLTAHRSKGLQADYVFIINNKNARMGFPSQIQDAPILDLLLDNYEEYPYAEERRLFYVAMTRARNKVFFLTVKDRESVFAQELESRYGEEFRRERYTCPLCGGRLVRRTGPYGDFFGCENYAEFGCKFTRKIKNT